MGGPYQAYTPSDPVQLVVFAGDAEARGEEYVAGGPYPGSLSVINVPKQHTLSQGSVPC